MDVIETKIDTSSDSYKNNYESMKVLVDELRTELKKAREDRSEKGKKTD